MRRHVLTLCVLAAVGGLAYSNIFDAPFIFDDKICIEENEVIRDLGQPGKLFLFTPTRFLAMVSFALNYALHGYDVWGYHLVNLVFHLGAGFALYGLVLALACTAVGKRVLGARAHGIAALGAALFLVHPVQTQAVTYTWQRSLVMATLLSFLALWFYVVMRQAWVDGQVQRAGRFCLAALVALVAGMFCKEITFTVPLMMLALELTVFRGVARPPLKFLLPFALSLLIIPGLVLGMRDRYAAVIPSEMEGYALFSPLTYLLTQIPVGVTYLRLLVWPSELHLDYQFPLAEGFGSVFPYLLVLLVPLALVVHAYQKQPMLCFTLVFFGLALSLEAVAVNLPDVIFEHRLYMGVGAAGCLFAGLLAHFLPRAFVPVGLVVVVLFGGLSWQRNQLWRDPVAFWSDNLTYAPGKARVWTSRALAYRKQGALAKALSDVDKAISLNEKYRLAYVTRALVLSEMGRHREAIADYDRTLELVAGDTDMINARGLSKMSLRLFDEALADFDLSLKHKPGQSHVLNYRGVAKMELDQVDGALEDFNQALSLRADFAEVLINRAALYRKLDRADDAIADYRRYLSGVPDRREVYTTLARLLFAQQQQDEALALLLEAVARFPDYVTARKNLGVLYYSQKQYGEAVASFRQAVALKESGELFYALGLAELELGNKQAAAEAFERARSLGHAVPADVLKRTLG